MKRLIILLSFVLCFFTLKGQDSTITKDQASLLLDMQKNAIQSVTDSSKWIPYINASFTGLNIQYVGGANPFQVSSLSALSFGASFQKFNYITNNIDFALNVDLLESIKIGGTENINLGLAVGVGLFNNVLTPSLGWYAGQKYPCGLINVSIIQLLKSIQIK